MRRVTSPSKRSQCWCCRIDYMSSASTPTNTLDAPIAIGSRLWRWVNASATNRAITILFALGVALRVFVMAVYSDVVLNYYGGDSTRYLRLPFTGYRALF